MSRFVSCAPLINTDLAPTSSSQPLTHYCIVRRDLPVGLQAANLVHAAGESSPGALEHGTFAVALHARDEAHLREILYSLVQGNVPHAPILETEGEHAGELMAIGVVPAPRQEVRRWFSSLPLIR